MQVLLRRSDDRSDITCSICGLGFRLYWERSEIEEQEAMRPALQDCLREHHRSRNDKSGIVHPSAPFIVPEWPGPAQFSGAAMLGGLSGIRRIHRSPDPHKR